MGGLGGGLGGGGGEGGGLHEKIGWNATPDGRTACLAFGHRYSPSRLHTQVYYTQP